MSSTSPTIVSITITGCVYLLSDATPADLSARRAGSCRDEDERLLDEARHAIQPENLRLQTANRRGCVRKRLARTKAQHDRREEELVGRVERRPLWMNQGFGAERYRDVEHAADFEPEELWRRHADDRERHALDRQRRADHVRAIESLPPEAITDDRDRSRRSPAPNVVGCGQRAADRSGDSERCEEVAADEQHVGRLDLAGPCEVEAQRRHRQRAGERLCALLQARPHRVRPPEPGREPQPRRRFRRDGDEGLWMGDGQRSQEQAIDDAEHRRSGPDRQPERTDGDRGEDRSPAERAQRVKDVASQALPYGA